ncbi:MAG: SOS response-associated peptidase [Chloroflexi bacterium]|nr:SOS response-associated peptidase [Chloroflexota bacterium]MDL1882035.1 SOS response-associated peptidase [Anaerolineae bacterium CFX8]
MCGRFVLTSSLDTIQTAFGLDNLPASLPPRYNIAPTQPVAIVTNEKPQELTFYQWGLIPSWAKDPSIGSRMINARSESAAEKPAFRAAFKRRRCIIPADGFYEWQARNGGKAPLFIHLGERELFGMAGLWEVWHSPEGDEVRTCTILTTDANDFMQPIHNRMPVILRRDDYDLWLSPDEPPSAALQALMKPYDPAPMRAYEVSKMVNRPGNDTPDCIRPVA